MTADTELKDDDVPFVDNVRFFFSVLHLDYQALRSRKRFEQFIKMQPSEMEPELVALQGIDGLPEDLKKDIAIALNSMSPGIHEEVRVKFACAEVERLKTLWDWSVKDPIGNLFLFFSCWRKWRTSHMQSSWKGARFWLNAISRKPLSSPYTRA